jgi:outer membrane lipoprotein-sorting protein
MAASAAKPEAVTLRDAGGAFVNDAGPDASATTLPLAEPGSAEEVAATVDELFTKQRTYKARFKQDYVAKVAGVTKTSTGMVSVERPSKISFRYDAPNMNRIVSDGATLAVYTAEDGQMFTQPVAKTEYPGALAFIMGRGLRASFTFTFNDKAKFEGGPVLVGKPRGETPAYESVLFYIDRALLEKKSPGAIRRVLVLDAQGNKNRFDFEGAEQPASFDASEFTFTPPPGTHVVAN